MIRMKVLVLVARGFQLGQIGCYGNDWIATPALDALAASGVVFDQHFADQPDAEGARRSWRTGRCHLPPFADSRTSLAEPDLIALLQAHHVPRCLVVDGSAAEPSSFLPGWDRVFTSSATGDMPLESALDAVGDALDHLEASDHWLLWADLATLLPPWRVTDEDLAPYFGPGEEDDEEEAVLEPLLDLPTGPVAPNDDQLYLRLLSSYAAAVTLLDSGIGILMAELQHRKLDQQTLVLVTSDHGQALGEHGIVGPSRPWLHEELVHLPLIVRHPQGTGAGRRVFGLTQACDLMPTLLDVFGLACPPDVHGQSLWPLLNGGDAPARAYACSGLAFAGQVEWSLRTPRWAFLLPGPAPEDATRSPQLYVKPDDRWEVNNVIQHHLELTERMEKTLRDFTAAAERPGPLQAPPLDEEERTGDAPAPTENPAP